MGAEISTTNYDSSIGGLQIPHPAALPKASTKTSTTNSNTNSNKSNNNHINTNKIKPNKVKISRSYFQSKPSHLVDSIVNKDWQKVLNRCTSHPKEIYMTHKIRLYGVDRKLLPLHIAVAMRPPPEVIAAMLRPDTITGMSTVKTLMKNSKKKKKKGAMNMNMNMNMNIGMGKKMKGMTRGKNYMNNKGKMKYSGAGNGNGNGNGNNNNNGNGGTTGSRDGNGNMNIGTMPMGYPQVILQRSASSFSNSVDAQDEKEQDGHTQTQTQTQSQDNDQDQGPDTCKTAPLSPSRTFPEDSEDDPDPVDGDGDEIENLHSVEEDEHDEQSQSQSQSHSHSNASYNYSHNHNHNQIFFPEKENRRNGYALQITPSGQIKQISPSGKSCRNNLDSESPFVYASMSHSHVYATGTGNDASAHGHGHGQLDGSLHSRSHSHHSNSHLHSHSHSHSHSYSNSQSTFQSALADDFLPIHIAILYRASPEVIALLLKCHPDGVQEKNKWGMLPIHILCSNYSLNPPSITASNYKLDDDFSTKAYLNCLYEDLESLEEYSKNWEMDSLGQVMEMLLKVWAPCVHIPSDNIEWFTPLEYAMRNVRGERRDEVVEILKMVQEQQQQQNTNTSASYNGNGGAGNGNGNGGGGVSSVNVSCDGQSLSSSLSDSKASSFIGGNSTRIKAFPVSDCPLLYTYISGKQWEVTKERITQVPEEASYWIVDTDYPRLPIHLACTNQAPREVIEALLDAYPEGCVAREGSGSHPLHLACANGLSLETVLVLLKKSKKAARIKDDIGRLPLHLACANVGGANLLVVKALIDAFPGSCSMKDYNGHTALTYVDYSDYEDTVKDQFNVLFEEYEDRFSGSGSISGNGNGNGGGNGNDVDVIQEEDSMREEEGFDNHSRSEV